MRIDDIRPDSTRPDATGPAAPVTGPAQTRAINPALRDRSDQVQISAEARALAAQAADGSDHADALSPERVTELRRWIQSGGFDAPEAIDAVARRLLSSGEI